MPARNILLLPGMMCDERLWAAQINSLEMPTFVADMTTADNIVDLAQNVLREAPPQFAMAGLSMGGILAFEIWRQAPERVSHLALLDTNPLAEAADRQSTRLQHIKEVLSGRLRELAIDSLKPVYLAKAHRDNETLLNSILGMTMDLGPEVFRQQSIVLKDRPDSVPTLATIDCPTVVMCGDEDVLCPLHLHELMANKIPDAKLVIIDNCGHLSAMEQPEVVSRELRKLLMH